MSPADRINDLLDAFDFERVHRAMVALNWRWGPDPGEVPTVSDLRRCARRLLRDAKPGYATSTGGLYVERDKSGDYELSFRIDSLTIGTDGEIG